MPPGLLSDRRFVVIIVILGLLAVETLFQKFGSSATTNDRSTPTTTSSAGRGDASDNEDEGSLAREERQGGHLIRKHVGQSPEQLRARLDRERNISAASTFTDLATAQEAVAAALRGNRDRISRWLAESSPRLVVNYTAAQNIGITLRRNDREAEPTRQLRLVLVRDTRESDGYRILTGYPTP